MVAHTPEWVKHAVFYQIFPDRLARGQAPDEEYLFPGALEDWDRPPSLQGYKGGNLWGVLERLDYLQDLGINAIYFTPVFQSAVNHRYHTHDYYRIDPLLGGERAFFTLLEQAHRRNIRIVLDGVFNHVSRGFFFFNDILENGPHSPWLDWFKIHGWPLAPYDGRKPANYAGWFNNRALPEFNHANPAVREYLMRVAEYWLRQGVDGWRLDVPDCIREPGFWEEFRERVKAVNPEAYIVGEIAGDARQWLDGRQFDGVMNYLFRNATLFFASGKHGRARYRKTWDNQPLPALDAPGYADYMQWLLELYPWEHQLAQLNLLASHDTARPLSVAGGDRDSVHLATLLLMTSPGAPCVYYGDEIGLEGGSDPDCRRGFPMERIWHYPTLEHHRELIALRHAHPALRVGDYRVLHARGRVYVFARRLEQEWLIIGLNTGGRNARALIPLADILEEGETGPPQRPVYGEGEVATRTQAGRPVLELSLPARRGLVLAR